MKNRYLDLVLALLGGSLLAVMINLNSRLAEFTTPFLASWVAHGIGAIMALAIVMVIAKTKRSTTTNNSIHLNHNNPPKSPKWSYLGGIPGALTVVFAAITVNSPLGLAGTLALGLVGQIMFGTVVDNFGLFGLDKKPFSIANCISILPIAVGSTIIIFFGI